MINRDQPTKHIGKHCFHYESTDSTNNRAAEYIRDEAYSGTVFSAGMQSQGRGQHGRIWQSLPDQNVLMSILLFPPVSLRKPAILTAWIAIAVSEAILSLTAKQARIKWPNDVLIQGKKICGILVECGVSQSGANPHYIVGLGVNVNQTREEFDKQELTSATSLRDISGTQFEVSAVRQEIIHQLDREYDRLLTNDISTLEACWKWRMGFLGREVTVELMDANEVRGRLLEMTFEGIDLQRRDGGTQRLRPEEIRHIREGF